MKIKLPKIHLIILILLGLVILIVSLNQLGNQILAIETETEEQGTIFLPNDCSNYGIWDNITSTCTLTQNLTESVQITENNITLDCNGHSITGSGTKDGISLSQKNNVTIKNCNVTNFSTGINLYFSNSNSFINNILNSNQRYGIRSYFSSNNTITGNTVDNTFYGIYLNSSSNNTITFNTVNDNNYGISLYTSNNNIIVKNTANENRMDFYIYTQSDTDCENIIENNTGSGDRPIKFYNASVNLQNEVLSELILCNADDSNINSVIIEGSASLKNNGFFVLRTDNSDFTNINSSNNDYGIFLRNSSNNTLTHNMANNNNLDGIALAYSSSNTLVSNTVENNGNDGIYLVNSLGSMLTSNTVNNNYFWGIYSWHSSNNTLNSNITNSNKGGIILSYSSSSILTDNTANNNTYGIALVYASNNNILVNNTANNNQLHGLYTFSSAIGNVINSNTFCNNNQIGGSYYDIYDADANSGNTNTCNTTYNWNDTGVAGCTYSCLERRWSFTIITDLHIGFDIPDYDERSYNDISAGQDYYLSKRLEAIVGRINEIKDDYNVKFVTVLGDISDTAEYSELLKARNILSRLNDPNGDGDLSDGIPYIPLIGNHDVWPYTQKEGVDPDIRGEENQATIADSAIGDQYFEGIFWCSFDTLAETKEECLAKNKNLQKILDLFGEFSRQENKDFPYLQNYAFSYKGIGFISLDYIEVARESKPGYKEILPRYLPLTTGWLKYNLLEYEDKSIILFSHDPYFTDNYSLKLSEEYFLFAGHIHDRICNDNITDESNLKCKSMAKFRFGAVPTEALLEDYENIIRVVLIKDIENPIKEDINYSKIEGVSKEIASDEIKRPTPYIIYTPSNPAPNEELTFIAKDEIREEAIKSCKWDFGDGTSDNSGKCEVTYSYSPILLWKYTVNVKITYTDDTQRIAEKSLWVAPKFKLKAPQFIFPSLLIDEEINVAQTPQNTPESIFIAKTASEKKPVGIIGVHFEEATTDIDLSNLVANISLETRKSILYMLDWPDVIEDEKILFIPSAGIGTVYLCPYATSLTEVTPQCEDIKILDVRENKENLFVDMTIYNGQEYYIVYGVRGTGGGEFGAIEKAIKDLNDYIQGIADKVFENNPEQRKNALKNKLEEVFVKIENNESQDAMNKLQNDIRAKTDGFVDGNLKDDWIIDPVVQKKICKMIDDLITYLQSLL